MKTRLRIAMGVLLATVVLGSTGCLRSRMIITSDPPEATVFLEHKERGDTPIEIPFIWYWYYDIELTKEGYEPFHTSERLRSKPWFIFPLDLVAEAMPFPIYDTRELHYELKPLPKKTPATSGQ